MTLTAGLYEDISSSDYHADIWGSKESPTFSRGVAHLIYSRSPLAAMCAHPKLGGVSAPDEESEDLDDEPEEENKGRDEGGLYHGLLLGGGASVAVIDADNFRTKAAREQRDQAKAEGLIPIVAGKWQAVRRVADRMRESLSNAGIDTSCQKEVTALWVDGAVNCKARFDLYNDDGPEIIIDDLKVVEYINVDAFRTDRFGLDIQAYAYRQAVEALFPKMAGRVRFRFVLVEKRRPYDVAVIPAGKSLLALGGMKWRLAKEAWTRCLETGLWPGIGGLPPAEASSWQLTSTVAKYIESFGEDSLTEIGGDISDESV